MMDIYVNKKEDNCIVLPSNTFWTHDKTGDVYHLREFANASGDRWPVMCVYSDKAGNTWARPIEEWIDRYTIKQDQIEWDFYE